MKNIFKGYGSTVTPIVLAVGTTIGVNLKENQKLILFFLILKMGDIFSLSEEARKEASPKTASRGVAGLEESDLKVR